LGAALSILRPSDPSAPNTHWLGLTPDFSVIMGGLLDMNPSEAEVFKTAHTFADDILQYARGRHAGAFAASMLDPVTHRLADEPRESHKRMRVAGAAYDGGQSWHSGAQSRHAGSNFQAPRAQPSAANNPEYPSYFRDATKRGESTRGFASMHPLAPAPHYANIAEMTTGLPG